MSPEEDRTRDTVAASPSTTNWAIPAPDHDSGSGGQHDDDDDYVYACSSPLTTSLGWFLQGSRGHRAEEVEERESRLG